MPAVLVLCWSAGNAMAQQPTDAQKNAIRNNCRSDYMANCSSVTPGGVEALQCLKHHSANLSSACRSAVAAIKPPAVPTPAPIAPATTSAPTASVTAPTPTRAAAPAAAPTAPHRAAPAATAPQQAAPAATPAAHTVGPPRRPTSTQHTAIRQACQADFTSRCPGVQPRGTQALHCLQGHAPELSANCRHALAVVGGPAATAAAAAPVAQPPAAAAEPSIGPIPPLPIRFRLEILNICRAEQTQFCSAVPAGAGRLIDCLLSNQASISPGCRRA